MNESIFDYKAISIDTSIFIKYGLRLDRGLLKEIEQFSSSPVQVLISDIVIREVNDHYSKKVSASRNTLKSATRDVVDYIGSVDFKSMNESVEKLPTNEEITSKHINSFLERCSAKVLNSAEFSSIEEVLNKYFLNNPPFEAVGDKKSEFPDAIALVSLEFWAKSNDEKVKVVSTDKGWVNYCRDSEWLDCSDNLADALQAFQPHSLLNTVLGSITEDYLMGKDNYVLQEIRSAVSFSLENTNISGEANSDLNYEFDGAHSVFVDLDFPEFRDGLFDVTFVRVEAGKIVFLLGLNVSCEVYGDFSFFVEDSIDKDYLNLGGVEVHREHTFYTDILVTLAGDFSNGYEDASVVNVEVVDPLIYYDFGYVSFRREQEE